MSITVVPFQQAHMHALEGRESETLMFDALQGRERCAALCDLGEYAYTVLQDDLPIACIGVSRYWRGVGSAWAFMAPDAIRPVTFRHIHRGVQMFLDGVFADGEFWRIETVVQMRFSAAHRWALRLGFMPEGIKRRHGYDGSDFMSYARVA